MNLDQAGFAASLVHRYAAANKQDRSYLRLVRPDYYSATERHPVGLGSCPVQRHLGYHRHHLTAHLAPAHLETVPVHFGPAARFDLVVPVAGLLVDRPVDHLDFVGLAARFVPVAHFAGLAIAVAHSGFVARFGSAVLVVLVAIGVARSGFAARFDSAVLVALAVDFVGSVARFDSAVLVDPVGLVDFAAHSDFVVGRFVGLAVPVGFAG